EVAGLVQGHAELVVREHRVRFEGNRLSQRSDCLRVLSLASARDSELQLSHLNRRLLCGDFFEKRNRRLESAVLYSVYSCVKCVGHRNSILGVGARCRLPGSRACDVAEGRQPFGQGGIDAGFRIGSGWPAQELTEL